MDKQPSPTLSVILLHRKRITTPYGVDQICRHRQQPIPVIRAQSVTAEMLFTANISVIVESYLEDYLDYVPVSINSDIGTNVWRSSLGTNGRSDIIIPLEHDVGLCAAPPGILHWPQAAQRYLQACDETFCSHFLPPMH
eukprot:scaffold8015_cov26-Prasinocladus_malaysianus.AAC.1